MNTHLLNRTDGIGMLLPTPIKLPYYSAGCVIHLENNNNNKL